jgi:WD repeat-containing protein 68
MEWSPSRRGTLASGGDDSLVLVWDLLGAASMNGNAGGVDPTASWVCDYEVGNISWAPKSGLTSQGGDWLGVSGGWGVWGVAM